MPRVFAVLLFLAILVPPLYAQRRGGGGGGGHFVMRGSSASFGARVAVNSGARFSQRGFVGRGGFVRHRPFFPVHHFHNRFFYGYPGIYAYPYYGYPYYDTLGFGYSSYHSSYDSSAAASYTQNQQLSQQLYSLDSEVRDLRDQNDQLRYDLEKRRYRGDEQPQPSPIPQSSRTVPEPPAAVFIFKDGVHLDSPNYAIVGQTLWILSPQRALKYPLAQLDYDATKKANADRGLDLTLPAPVNSPTKPPAPSALHGD